MPLHCSVAASVPELSFLANPVPKEKNEQGSWDSGGGSPSPHHYDRTTTKEVSPVLSDKEAALVPPCSPHQCFLRLGHPHLLPSITKALGVMSATLKNQHEQEVLEAFNWPLRDAPSSSCCRASLIALQVG